jgi:hypothetical protein
VACAQISQLPEDARGAVRIGGQENNAHGEILAAELIPNASVILAKLHQFGDYLLVELGCTCHPETAQSHPIRPTPLRPGGIEHRKPLVDIAPRPPGDARHPAARIACANDTIDKHAGTSA